MEDPEDSCFSRFVHVSNEDIPFEVEKVEYNSQDMDEIKPSGSIEGYSVWYWKKDGNMTNPLLVEMEESDSTYEYHFNKRNNQWDKLPEHKNSQNPLDSEDLEKVLDDLNCDLNQAVTMDLSFKNSESHTKNDGNDNQYCCGYHRDRYKVTVSKGSVNAGKGARDIPYYKHELYSGVKLAKIKYYPNGDNTIRKRITITGINLPIKGSLSVYTFYCEDKDPVLIYLDYNEQDSVKGWYKKNKDDIKPWIKVLNDLSTKTPDNIKDCNDEFNKLVTELKDFNCTYNDCVDATNQQALVTTQSDPGVTIELKQKPSGAEHSATIEYKDPTGNKKITVIRYPGPPQGSDFLKFIHTPNGQSFKLKEVQDDLGKRIDGPTGNNVSSVSVYYWKHETNKNPLLIEIQDGSKYSYYTKRNGKWISHNISKPGSPTQAELELLNCEINDVVQIDVTKVGGEYCHMGDVEDNHDVKKVNVTDVACNQLGMYKAYSHTPSSGVFKISTFTGGRTQTIKLGGTPGKPINNVNKVIVYLCISDYQRIPLLIYVDSEQLSSDRKWFKSENEGITWKEVVGLSNENDYPKIVETLDKLGSKCGPPSVTIDVYNRRSTIDLSSYAYYSGKYVNVTSKNTGTFTEYVHTIHGRTKGYFTVKEFHYNYKRVGGKLGSTEKVTNVSVFYWKYLEKPYRNEDKRGRPLLLKVTLYEGDDRWYENKGEDLTNNTDWKEVEHPSDPDREFKNPAILENKLHLLNCKLNNTVVIDVSKKDTTYDACEKDEKLDPAHGERIQISKDTTAVDKLGGYEVYTHKLKDDLPGTKFHIVGFINGGTTFREILSGISSLPILDVSEVKVYFCKQEPTKPLLIHYNTSNGGSHKHKWYKNPSGETPGDWELESSELSNAGPCSYEEILKVLNNLPSSCNPEEARKTEKLIDGASATVLTTAGMYGVISGVFGGAGATGLAGWKLYKNFKGDPWVRQI
ncbi:hypothetical protein BEWA_001900 [Theileria equi strain WA]|uniref:Uncharacterized protein n=1 Tax=Theileria equi strain WA TaxID=1537102 RepID=L0AZU3_THEEQ|nr:hypothetical protein BEWA_001900 [Theileria equi strain WA]AFZ80783.1 hypothetical protein BEWA_001900 [Theileria equi strain WA]|eukprot:XP_004830449.1 hypothetical protein BEWA_001900 [Theileria equi strain WA]